MLTMKTKDLGDFAKRDVEYFSKPIQDEIDYNHPKKQGGFRAFRMQLSTAIRRLLTKS